MKQEELERLAASGDWQERWKAAEDRNCPPEVLASLAGDANQVVRAAVAGNPNTPPELLAKLAEDEDRYVRHAVADNSNTPPNALGALSEDKGWWIRAAVADNFKAPPETLARLAGDEIRDVREAAADNTNTPPETLRYLAHDGDEDVRNAARFNLEERGLGWNLKGETRKDLLHWLAGHKDEENRKEAARASDCPPEALARLAMDEDWGVRYAVIHNPSTPLAAWAVLAGDDMQVIRRGVAYHHNAPPEVLAAMARSRMSDTDIRLELAKNLATPDRALERLSEDGNESVRAAARKQLEQRQREAACADYEAGLEAGASHYGPSL